VDDGGESEEEARTPVHVAEGSTGRERGKGSVAFDYLGDSRGSVINLKLSRI
jgi:hypothetical protein